MLGPLTSIAATIAGQGAVSPVAALQQLGSGTGAGTTGRRDERVAPSSGRVSVLGESWVGARWSRDARRRTPASLHVVWASARTSRRLRRWFFPLCDLETPLDPGTGRRRPVRSATAERAAPTRRPDPARPAPRGSQTPGRTVELRPPALCGIVDRLADGIGAQGRRGNGRDASIAAGDLETDSDGLARLLARPVTTLADAIRAACP